MTQRCNEDQERIQEDQYAYLKLWNQDNILEVIKHGLLRNTHTQYSIRYACMTRSLTNELFTPYKEPERKFRSSRRHFKTLSLDELRSPDFNLLSDEEYSEEEEDEIAEKWSNYMAKS
ncbi:hypothetical protein Tco_0615008 [Tanacetum coccineum]